MPVVVMQASLSAGSNQEDFAPEKSHRIPPKYMEGRDVERQDAIKVGMISNA